MCCATVLPRDQALHATGTWRSTLYMHSCARPAHLQSLLLIQYTACISLYCLVQGPAVATVLVIGTSQLMGPAISFINDMKPHCRGLRQNAAIPAFIGLLTLLGILWVLHPPSFGGDLLLQNELPFRFRLILLCYIAAYAVAMTVTVQLLRRYIAHYQAGHIKRLSAGVYVPMSIDMNRAPVGRRSFDGRDAALRTTASTDVGDWLRRTASAVADLTALLPGQRPSNRVHQDVEQLPL